MKITPFGNNVAFSSSTKKSANSDEKKAPLDTKGAKNILSNTLLLTATGLLAWLSVDTIMLKKSVSKGMAKITETISQECQDDFNKAMKYFNDWQKKDFIDAFNSSVNEVDDKTNLALRSIVKVVNTASEKNIIDEVPTDSKAGFELLFSKWLKS